MKMVVIISGGQLHSDFLRRMLLQWRDTFLIAADRGLEACRALSLVPDVVIGDFDSLGEDEKKQLGVLKEQGVRLIFLNPVKDDTDTEAALHYAFEETQGEIVILGGTGTRLDHVMGNIAILGQGLERGRQITLLDEHNRIRMTKDRLMIPKNRQYGRYVSVLPFGGEASGVTLEGFFYPLADVTMHMASSLGISNEIVASCGVISVKKGTLLVIESKD